MNHHTNPIRFISVIEQPGRIWSDHCVVDTMKNIIVCKSSEPGLADSVAKCLNLQWLVKGGDVPVALLAPTFDELDAQILKNQTP